MKKLLVFFVLLSTIALGSCEKRNLRQLVKDMAEAAVDTTGMEARSILLDNFSAVSIDCFADVTYHQTALTDTPSVTLQALPEVLKNVRVKVDNGELQVDINHRYRMPDNAVVLMDVYAPFISRVRVSGAKCFRLGKVAVQSPLEVKFEGLGALTADSISTPELFLHTAGGASADVSGLQVQHVRLKQEERSVVWVKGSCMALDVEAEQDTFVNVSGLQVVQQQ